MVEDTWRTVFKAGYRETASEMEALGIDPDENKRQLAVEAKEEVERAEKRYEALNIEIDNLLRTRDFSGFSFEEKNHVEAQIQERASHLGPRHSARLRAKERRWKLGAFADKLDYFVKVAKLVNDCSDKIFATLAKTGQEESEPAQRAAHLYAFSAIYHDLMVIRAVGFLEEQHMDRLLCSDTERLCQVNTCFEKIRNANDPRLIRNLKLLDPQVPEKKVRLTPAVVADELDALLYNIHEQFPDD